MPNMLELCGITLDDLRALYEREQSVARVAKKLGVSKPTAIKWCKIAQIKTRGHRPPINPTCGMVGEYGIIAKWIRDNNDKKLPRTPSLIAQLVGCSPMTASSYFYRRKKRILRYLESFGDLKERRIVFASDDGRNINTRLINSYHISFDPWRYQVSFYATIGESTFICSYALKDFLTILKDSCIVDA